ncbi:MAG: alpha/beta hydrolase [Haliea sp.]|nr:MAG: alpha/beta hydrolase [Haliea sp.]
MRIPSWTLLLLSLGMLVGCFPRGDPSRPIPTALVVAPEKARRLVVVLPGRADDIADLRASGIAQAVQSAWPDADVLLTGLALGFYLEGRAEMRLQDEIIAPARARGYAQIWLVGASLGGMGALLHQRSYPGGVDGMVLLAPYLGESAAQPLLLQHLEGLRREPERARSLWLAYGRSDRLRGSMPLLEPLLPPGQVLVRDGGHDWELWSPVTGDILRRVDARPRASGTP